MSRYRIACGRAARAGCARLTFVACGMVLGGCTMLQPQPETQPETPEVVVETPPTPPPRRVSDPELLLSYHTRLRRLAGPDLVREHEVARQAAGQAQSEYNRVRLAMVLSLPGTSFQDDQRALGLLDPVARNSNGDLSALASLLAAQIQERRRIEANAQALQQKLDALRSLERSLIERKR